MDGDGCDDFVSGGGDTTAFAGAGAGGGILFSGRTGKVLVVGLDEQQGDNLGAAVDGCGDMDGDRIPDFVAGGGQSQRVAVRAFSGRTGQGIRSWTNATVSTLGGLAIKSGGIDIDQDGVPEVISSDFGSRERALRPRRIAALPLLIVPGFLPRAAGRR